MQASSLRIAVVGAGLSGAVCARLLADAGCGVSVFDKSRGVGGRLATRRADWAGADGHGGSARWDHGAPGFSARSADFLQFLAPLQRDGVLQRWSPRLAPGGYAPIDEPALWVPVPDMPALCRALLGGLAVRTECPVEALASGPSGWTLLSAGLPVAGGFDAVVLALPAPQAVPLLRAHLPAAAERADALPMQPCWTLMAVTDAPARPPDWVLAWPAAGPLATVVRQDAKPGRVAVAGLAHWVVHASADWSLTHLESSPADVQPVLQDALASLLGAPVGWRHAVVHRWRYASAAGATAGASGCAWDDVQRLGACGDAWGGGGVEGAWRSARELAHLIVHHPRGSQARGR